MATKPIWTMRFADQPYNTKREYVSGLYRIIRHSDRQWWLYFDGKAISFGPRRKDAMQRAIDHAKEACPVLRYADRGRQEAEGSMKALQALPQLLPCPFCGRSAHFEDPESHARGVGYHISCDPCYLHMWAFRLAENGKIESPEMLAERWNKRSNAQKGRRR